MNKVDEIKQRSRIRTLFFSQCFAGGTFTFDCVIFLTYIVNIGIRIFAFVCFDTVIFDKCTQLFQNELTGFGIGHANHAGAYALAGDHTFPF